MINVEVVTMAFEMFTDEELERVESLARDVRVSRQTKMLEANIAEACTGARQLEAVPAL